MHIAIWVAVWQFIEGLNGAISYIIPFFIEASLFVILLLLNALLSYKNRRIGKMLIITALIVWLSSSTIMLVNLFAKSEKPISTDITDISVALKN